MARSRIPALYSRLMCVPWNHKKSCIRHVKHFGETKRGLATSQVAEGKPSSRKGLSEISETETECHEGTNNTPDCTRDNLYNAGRTG